MKVAALFFVYIKNVETYQLHLKNKQYVIAASLK